MRIVSYPSGFSERLLKKFGELLENGSVAEGEFYGRSANDFVPGKKSVPVNSCGSALFALLAYQKYVHGKTHVLLQSNTMRGLYTVSKLLHMKVTVIDSTVDPGFMAMDPNALRSEINRLKKRGGLNKVVTLYSVIGGYLSPAYQEIETINRENGIPLIVDLAHGHYLDRVIGTDYADLAFSFYATKILPVGEGGLISTRNDSAFEWIKKFLIYDRFDYKLDVGINLRANELTSFFIHLLMTDKNMKEYFADRRVKIGELYKKTCKDNNISFLDPGKSSGYNGYKFIVFDPFDEVKKKNTVLTLYQQTSPVFNVDIVTKRPLLPHWCPPTYPSLYEELITKGSR
jgi:dTDP-4-amino-4,6-dideoxygalactose transaminase